MCKVYFIILSCQRMIVKPEPWGACFDHGAIAPCFEMKYKFYIIKVTNAIRQLYLQVH